MESCTKAGFGLVQAHFSRSPLSLKELASHDNLFVHRGRTVLLHNCSYVPLNAQEVLLARSQDSVCIVVSMRMYFNKPHGFLFSVFG